MAAFTEPARGRAAAGEAPVAMATSAQFMITHAMRRTLIEDLGFAREEVEVLRPEIAAQLIQNETRRPFGDRSLPDDWKRRRSPPRTANPRRRCRRGGGQAGAGRNTER